MARKRYLDEDALKVLREIDVHLHDGLDVVSSCRKAGISDKTYYYWRKKFGGMGRSQLFRAIDYHDFCNAHAKPPALGVTPRQVVCWCNYRDDHRR